MNAELSATVGFGAAAATSLIATPLAIKAARRLRFYDRPREYRKHAAPTPFLGGAAVLIGFLIAAVAVGGASGRLLVILGWAIVLGAIGTLDDRSAVAPQWRLVAEALAAISLVAVGLEWETTAGDGLDFLVTVFWVVALVTSFNLLDNMDGACGTVGCVSAVGIGVVGAIHGEAVLAGLAFALAGACAGFLPSNLAGPAKIFLGDGGSMVVGYLVAALAIATCRLIRSDASSMLTGSLLVAVAVLDTALVIVSRRRRGISLVTGGRDHLTHRLSLAVGSPRAVAATLALAQGSLCLVAVIGDQIGSVAIAAVAAVAAAAGVAAIAVLDTPRWRPADIVIAPVRVAGQGAQPSSAGIDSG